MFGEIFKKYKGMFIFYFIIRYSQVIVSATAVVFFQRTIDGINAGLGLKSLLTVLVGYGVFQIGNYIICYVWNYPQTFLDQAIPQQLRIMALEKISKMDYAEYQKLGTGSLIKMIDNGVEAGKKIYLGFFIEIICGVVPNILIGLFIIGTYNKQIIVYILVGYLFVFVFTKFLLRYLYAVKNRILVDEESISRRSLRAMMEFVVFRLNRRYRFEIDTIEGTAKGVIGNKAKMIMIHEAFFTLFAVFVGILKILILIFGIGDIAAGITTIGAIIALMDLVERVYQPIAIFNVIYVEYKLDKVAFARLLDFFRKPDDPNLSSGKRIADVKGEIEFRDVRYEYDEIPVLKKVSLKVSSGSRIALVGESGAGKSTVVKLALGFLKAKSGTVLVDGLKLDELCLSDFYRQVSYIAQDAPVFDGTIKENIVFQETASDEEVFKILELVSLKTYVDGLPNGIYTEVGEKGTRLSGGERQRLAFARVFFQKSKIIILDEPTSAMDSITEDTITENLMELFKDRTILIVAHRLQTVKDVDAIFVFQNGEIVENGGYAELIEKRGLFYSLWNKQNLSE